MFHRITLFGLLVVAVGCTSSTTEPAVAPSPTKSTSIQKTLENPTESASKKSQVTVEPGSWGTLKGRFVFDGTPPSTSKLTPTKDLTVCGKHDLFNESLIVNPENKGYCNRLPNHNFRLLRALVFSGTNRFCSEEYFDN